MSGTNVTPDPQRRWVQDVLGVNFEVGESPALFDLGDDADTPLVGVVAYRKALLDFRAARADVRGQLAALSALVADTLPGEAKLAEQVAASIETFCDRLSNSIDDGINAMTGERGVENDRIQHQVLDLIRETHDDALIAHVDENPFMRLSVGPTLVGALTRVAASIV